jgi:hypothetical protein
LEVMRFRIALFVGVLIAGLLAQSGPALASFHLNKIVEVFGGTTEQPDAQYVELKMYSSGQNFVSGHPVIVYDAAGIESDRFTFSENAASGNDQDSMLVATTEAEALFGVQADLEMTATLDPAGGKVCFETIDCVSWGSFSAADSSTGDPFGPPFGLPAGSAIGRDISGGNDPNELDGGDDTNDSAADFDAAQALPTNNAGATGHLPGEEPPPPPSDTTPPVTFIVKPADSVVYKASRLTKWNGSSTDAGVGVGTVEVALRMTKRNGSCRAFDGQGFVAGPCSNRVFLTAAFSDGKWTFDAPSLKSSIGTKIKHYTISARASDMNDNLETTFERTRNSNRFEIK